MKIFYQERLYLSLRTAYFFTFRLEISNRGPMKNELRPDPATGDHAGASLALVGGSLGRSH